MATTRTKKSPFDDENTEPGQDNAPVGDEAQTETPPWEDGAGDVEVGVKTADANHATMIIKGKGYDGSSISVRGNSIPDLVQQVKEHWEDLNRVVKAAAELGKTFSELSGPSDSPKAPASTSGGNTGGSQTPAWVGSCDHGPRNHRSGVKNGNAWEAGFCPADVEGCKPAWKPKGK
jgi:hypothetical protein